jgi:hypothetical protein
MLKDVDDFRHLLTREEAKVAHQTRSIANEHQQKAARATFLMLSHDLDTDEVKLDKWVEEKKIYAQKSDKAICEYRSNRYKTGVERSEDFMHHRLRFVDIPGAKFVAREVSLSRRLGGQLCGGLGGGAPVGPGGGAPEPHMMFYLDLNIDYSSEMFAALTEVCKFLHAMPTAVLIIRLLARHCNHDNAKVVQIHRKIEDHLIKDDISLGHEGSVHFTTQAEHASDGRSLEMRYRIAVSNVYAKDSPWLQSAAARGNGGNAMLIRPRDMLTPFSKRVGGVMVV